MSVSSTQQPRSVEAASPYAVPAETPSLTRGDSEPTRPLSVPRPQSPQSAAQLATLREAADQAAGRFHPLDMEGLKNNEKLLTRLGRFADAARLLEWRLQHEDASAQTIADFRVLAIRWLQAGQFAKADTALDVAVAMSTSLGIQGRLLRDIAIDRAATRLFLGNIAGAQAAIAQADPGEVTATMIAAMIRHSNGDGQTLAQDIATLESRPGYSPIHLITIAAWHNAPDVALQILDKYIRQEPPAAEPVSAGEAQLLCDALLSSPFILASPARAALEASQAWQTLRERCGLVPEIENIQIPCDVPDLHALAVEVLKDMERDDLVAMAATLNPPGGRTFESKAPFYPLWSAPEVRVGVQLTAAGSQLLAAHFNRKYECSISSLNTGDPTLVAAELVRMIQQARSVPGDIRRALCFGTSHSVCAVYIREDDQEAILLADPVPTAMAPPGEQATQSLSAVLMAMDTLEIPHDVYVQSQSLQTDNHSCFTFAMKAAVTLTRRRPASYGQPGEYLIANLISELANNCDQEAFRLWPHRRTLPVRAVPEIAKMFQGRAYGPEVGDMRVRDSKRARTVDGFIRAHTVTIPVESRSSQGISAGPRTKDVVDYARQKGTAYAAIIDAERWNQAILTGAPAGRWDEFHQVEFIRELKSRIHAFTERAEAMHRARSRAA